MQWGHLNTFFRHPQHTFVTQDKIAFLIIVIKFYEFWKQYTVSEGKKKKTTTLRLLRKKRCIPEEKGDQQLINLSIMKICKIIDLTRNEDVNVLSQRSAEVRFVLSCSIADILKNVFFFNQEL